LNDNFEVLQNEDFTLEVRIEGDEVPDQVFLQADNYQIKLEKKSISAFQHHFVNVQKDVVSALLPADSKQKRFSSKCCRNPLSSILRYDGFSCLYPEKR
jgi:hypothetical protein